MSKACVPICIKWFKIRVISAKRTELQIAFIYEIKESRKLFVPSSYLWYTWLLGEYRCLGAFQQQENSIAHFPSWKHSPIDQNKEELACKFCTRWAFRFLCEVVRCADQIAPPSSKTKNNKTLLKESKSLAIIISTSPSSSITRRKTPWAAGCCGPIIYYKKIKSKLFETVISIT